MGKRYLTMYFSYTIAIAKTVLDYVMGNNYLPTKRMDFPAHIDYDICRVSSKTCWLNHSLLFPLNHAWQIPLIIIKIHKKRSFLSCRFQLCIDKKPLSTWLLQDHCNASSCFSQSSRSKYYSWLMMRTISRAFFGVNFHACMPSSWPFHKWLEPGGLHHKKFEPHMTKNLHFFSGRWEGNRHLAAHHHSFFTGLCKFRVISCVAVERTRGKSVEMIKTQKASLSR